MKKFAIYIITLLLLSACFRLDDLVFLGDTSITEYKLDDYEGEIEMPLGDDYDVPDSLISIIKIPVDDESTYGALLGETQYIYGVYIGDTNHIPTDTVIVYCHGQVDHMDYYWTRAELLGNLSPGNNISVLMFDYPEFGLSDPILNSDEGAMYDATASVLNWLKDKGSSHVVMYGFSLGSAPATYVTALQSDTLPIDALILESPFASADNLTQYSTIINTQAEYMTSLELNNAEWIKEVEQPLMWLHGLEDDYISIENGELVYKNHRGSYKEAHRIPNAGHGKNGVPENMGFDNYLDAILDFIRH